MIATRALLRPAVLLAIALLVLNDHVLKARFPGLLTGKLSDVAGLIFFPLLLAARVEQVGLRRGRAAVVAAAVATGLAFAAIKLWAPAADLYRVGLAALQWPFHALSAAVTGDALPSLGRVQLAQDPTDLLALPALFVPVGLAGCAGPCAGAGCAPGLSDEPCSGATAARERWPHPEPSVAWRPGNPRCEAYTGSATAS